jgi:hypothetical protein
MRFTPWRRLALLLVTVSVLIVGAAAPAVADPGHRNGDVWYEVPIVPAVDQFDLENPCTGEVVTFFWEGKQLIHEFDRANGYHVNQQLFISGYTSDGYTTGDAMHVALVQNVSDNTVAYKDNSNYVYTNDAGSKFRMTFNEHLTVVDGEVVSAVFDVEFLDCIRYVG